jgi:signal transduction histidine kinase
MKPIYQSYQQIEQFSADVAHELRTPLASSQVMVESTLRLNYISDSEARQTLQAVERQNNRLSQLVRDLLLLSHIQQKE